MIKSPDYISSIQPYVPGKPVEEVERELGIKDSVKLASNENPVGPSPRALEALKGAGSDLNRYPDSGAFYLARKLAQINGIKEEQIIMGNGSNEILNFAAYAFLTDKDSAVMAWPSFVVYPLATQSVGAESVKVPLKDMKHDLGAMVKAIKKNTKIVFIANPNNPTGTTNGKDEFARFMDAVPEGVLVVVDEAYYEYVQDGDYPDSMRYLKDGRDILILRTFSKIYGLAGLRIGYGFTTEEIATELNKVRPPFNTNSLAQMAAIAALDDDEHIKRSVAVNEEGKQFLYKELQDLGLHYVRTEANFIFVSLGDITAQKLNDELLRRGVIVRPMGEKAVRITIGLKDENERLIKAMKEIF
ncbi:MAG: histidinol-phosphate transaminase [Nitrospirota bacterium]|nr:MAG: histidinol-phosphate transaminase [Nitrospirota bacterium]